LGRGDKALLRKKRKDAPETSGDNRDMTRPSRLGLDRLPSPLGEILLVTDEAGAVRALDFHDYLPRMTRLLRLHYGDLSPENGGAPASVRQSLGAYFDGQLDALSAIAWATGGTAFQRAVWTALLDVPAGQTSTYAALAARLGKPAATRAVGAANGANPIAILVPCHRLVGATGALTGYGGGLERKAWLLRHEGARP
jgi:methylated-DNA-[protein]-cysteine S-methyltransferase